MALTGPIQGRLAQVPTIGNFLGDMEKFFEDEYESLKEKKDKCSLSRTAASWLPDTSS